jgi:quercetin dioxygenase-like cupin family protein
MTGADTHARGDTARREGAGPPTTPSARLVNHGRTLHVPGARVELLTPLQAADELPCLMRGTIPGGGVVPLHSHPDTETFVGVAGELEGLTRYPDGIAWVPLRAGDVFHVPGDVPHAWRNRSTEPATSLILTTTRLARFFCDIAAPASRTDPPDPEVLATFTEVARRYGYWHGSARENAAIGLPLHAS